MNQAPKKQFRKKPDYLIMLFTLVIVIGIFLFLREALAEDVANLSPFEIQTAAEQGHIKSIEYVLVGGDNFDLVRVNGVVYDQYKNLPMFSGSTRFESVMRIDQATAIFEIVEETGTTKIVVKSSVTVWTVLLNLVPIILIIVVLFIIFRNANSQNSKAFDFAKNRAKLNREKNVPLKMLLAVMKKNKKWKKFIDFLKPLKNTSIWEQESLKVFFLLVLLVLVKHYLHVQSLVKQTFHSSQSLVLIS
jgi:cell division protease FtsH